MCNRYAYLFRGQLPDDEAIERLDYLARRRHARRVPQPVISAVGVAATIVGGDDRLLPKMTLPRTLLCT